VQELSAPLRDAELGLDAHSNGRGAVDATANTSLTVTDGPTTLAKLRGLPWSMAGNSLITVFAQFTFFGSVFVLFLDTLGLSKSQIGILLSLLPFTNVVALIVAPTVARFGYKRTFLATIGARKMVTAFLLLTPWVVASYGAAAALPFVAVVVAIFALLRSIMEIAWIPWIQEFVPNSMRGKYAAADNVYVTLAGIAAISVAGLVIGRTAGLTGYMMLIGIGVLFGFGSLWCYTFLPGGAPAGTGGPGRTRQHNLREAIHDLDYRRYLIGVSLVTLATVPLASFLPLYLQEQVGIPSGQVVWVQVGTLAGALLSSYVWGWAADRYGSKPVMNSGVVLLTILPVFWWLVPRYAAWGLYVVLGIALLQGVANLGWIIGAGRLLFVSLVPPVKKVGYMALYSAWVGIVGGVSQLAGGRILDLSQGLSGQLAGFTIDPYVPLFLMSIILAAASFPVLQNIRAELAIGVREFVSIFFRGNPFVAVSALIRYQLARDEHSTVLMTEQLGKGRSRLPVEEMLEALSDPRL
jgi:MFS family permease